MEVPTAYLEPWKDWTDLDFVLAHKVLEDAAYAEFFAKRPSSRELIMDNSMHELGQALPISDLREAAKRCRANYVIAPDRLGEPEWNAQQFNETNNALSVRVGAVMSGRTYEERKRHLESVHHAAMLLLPYRENRLLWYLEFSTYIHFTFPRIHLLGVNELSELALFAAASRADTNSTSRWSVDTAKALKWGASQTKLTTVGSVRGNPLGSKELLDLTGLNEAQIAATKENVDVLKAICNGRDPALV
jgi:hypothetical protein